MQSQCWHPNRSNHLRIADNVFKSLPQRQDSLLYSSHSSCWGKLSFQEEAIKAIPNANQQLAGQWWYGQLKPVAFPLGSEDNSLGTLPPGREDTSSSGLPSSQGTSKTQHWLKLRMKIMSEAAQGTVRQLKGVRNTPNLDPERSGSCKPQFLPLQLERNS